MIEILVHGASGRMGRRLCLRAADRPGEFRVAGLVDARNPGEFRAQLDAHPGAVLIDFSLASAMPDLLGILIDRRNPLVSGTTGLSDDDRSGLARLAMTVAVVWAPNMGLGIPLLTHLVREAARLLPSADAAIVETHHRHKKDRPSGTAQRLAEAIGRPAEMHSLRIGEVVGDHQVELAFGGERLTLTHRALSRDVFADGALAAARFAVAAPPGVHDMEAVLAGTALRS